MFTVRVASSVFSDPAAVSAAAIAAKLPPRTMPTGLTPFFLFPPELVACNPVCGSALSLPTESPVDDAGAWPGIGFFLGKFILFANTPGGIPGVAVLVGLRIRLTKPILPTLGWVTVEGVVVGLWVLAALGALGAGADACVVAVALAV